MDARIDVHRVLDLAEGDAHVIRNAGGVVTDDTIRSLAISQRVLGTEEVVLVHHTDCGMLGFDDHGFRRALEEETGVAPPWEAAGLRDLEEGVRQAVARVKGSPFLPKRDRVRGFVYEVETGRLREVD
jgi:carbonic anhydrase